MLDYVSYEVVQNLDSTWDCYTYHDENNAYNHDDYTGVGLSAAEAYKDWMDSNNILVDPLGNHSYTIDLI